MYIPYGRQCIEEDDINAVIEVLRSDFLTTGPKVAEFEQAVAAYTGAAHAVAVSNGTAALHMACLAAGIGEGDEVITSAITFAASANCALFCGARPVFADIDPATYNIDPDDIRRKVTRRTKALIPVHFTGQPCDMDAIHAVADEYGLTVIEDAAHALGAAYKGKKIGALSDMTTLSFHPVKHVTTGEGGMILTNDEALTRRLTLFRSHGITREESMMHRNEGGWYYEQLELSTNCRLTDIQSALGISQISKLDRFVQRRREIARRYDEAFAGLQGIVTPYQAPDGYNSYHLYVIQVTHMPRRDAFDKLRAAGIGVNVHYIPVYKHPYYQTHGYADVRCPHAEALYERMISLPMYPLLTDAQQDYVIAQVRALRG